jgi:hypothetical protein
MLEQKGAGTVLHWHKVGAKYGSDEQRKRSCQMSGSRRKISVILFLVAIGCSAFCQQRNMNSPDNTKLALLGFSRATEIAGGLITLGFGVWHFAIPSAFGWYGYLQDDPAELSRAIGASNFFLSFSLSMVGATSVVLPALVPENSSANTVWLWANVGLWTARSIYQVVAPQGTQVRSEEHTSELQSL